MAALLVLLLAAGTSTALISTTNTSADQRLRAEANTLAAQDQDRLRGLSDEQLGSLNGSAGATHRQTFNGTSFTVASNATFVNASGASSCGSSQATNYRITSTVSWPESFGSASNNISLSSLIARPTTGNLQAIVDDQTGSPLTNVAIAATGPSSANTPTTVYASTDSSGCVLFAGLSAGNYNVTATQPGYVGYVNSTGASSSSTTTSVSALSAPSANSLSLGQAGTITADLTGAQGAAAEADGIEWSGSSANSQSMGAPGQATSTAAALSTFSTGASLYPFYSASAGSSGYAGNYSVWAGQCPQQKPPSPTTATVTPGSSQTLSVVEPQLDVTSVKRGAALEVPTDFVLSFTSMAGTSCTDSWPAAAATVTGTGGTNTPNGNWLADPGQPYADGTSGTLTVCADYTVNGTGYHDTMSTPNTGSSSVALTGSGSATKGTCPAPS